MSERHLLQRMLREKRITRREFATGMAAIGVAGSVPAFLSWPAKAATPNKGGKFRMTVTEGATGESLEPAQLATQPMIALGWQIRNNLVEESANAEPVGELAESWETSADASTWIFKLRKGVEFHNGKTFDSTDVVESFNHHRGEKSKSRAKSLLESVTDIRADGKDTVIFKLAAGSADFPFICSDYRFMICPAKPEGGIDWESGIGTGGYTLENFEPGVGARTKRNPNYWKAGRAHFDEVEIFNVSDAGARENGIRSGEFDAISDPVTKTVHLLDKISGLRMLKTTGNRHTDWPMDMTVAPFDNHDVRLALKYAVNREQLRDVILSGHGQVGNDTPIGMANQYVATEEEIPQRTYDPDKAKFHLKKAGLSSLKVSLSTSDTPYAGAVDSVVLYREAAAKAGIDIEVVREPQDGYWDNVWNVKPFTVSQWNGRATEDWMFSTAYAANAPSNAMKWSHERFNQLLLEARAELDKAKRREMYVEMQRICRDEGGAIVPLFMSFLHVVSDKLGMEDKLAANHPFDGLRAAERWWFK